MSLTLFKLKKGYRQLIKTRHANINACEKPCCDSGYCHHYGQGLWKWWNNSFLEWNWNRAFGLFCFLKKHHRGSNDPRSKPEVPRGDYSNVSATVRTNLLVYHESENDPSWWEMPRWIAYVSISASTCILFLLKVENARKQASYPTPTYRSVIWLHSWWKKS